MTYFLCLHLFDGPKYRMMFIYKYEKISNIDYTVTHFLCLYKILTGKPTGKRPLGRSRHRWEDNIRMDVEEIGINAGNWVHSAQDRDYWRALVNVALNLRVP